VDRVVILNEGRIVADGLPDKVFSDRETLRSLGLRRPVESALTPWQALMGSPFVPAPAQQPLIEFQNVSAGYNHHPVIHDINLALYPGEFVALVGDNGAGKSTLGLAAAGLIKPGSGRLRYQDGRRFKPGQDVSILFQNPADQLFTDSVDEEVSFGPQNFRVFNPAQHEEVLEEADLAALRTRRPTELSVGQQQRTALGACLAMKPRLIVLDEPTLGQDWGHLQRLMDFLSLLNQKGAAILLITHDYKLVHRYAQRVLFMQNGRIVSDSKLLSNQKRRTRK
jgi:energy-coupling factor transport system ATP-binding protein